MTNRRDFLRAVRPATAAAFPPVIRRALAEEHRVVAPAGQDRVRRWSLERSAHRYDVTVEAPGLPGFRRRFAGRVETGRHSLSDPAIGRPARGEPG